MKSLRFAAALVTALAAFGASLGVARAAQAATVRDLGALPGATPLRVGLLLRYRHAAELPELVRLQKDAGSPVYGHFLDDAAWNAYFAPDPGSLARVRSVLEAQGLRVDVSLAAEGLVTALAPAATLERVFQTEMHRIAQRGHGIRFTNVRPPVIPTALRSDVAAVIGLNGLLFEYASGSRPVPAHVTAADPVRKPRPITTSTPVANPNPEPTLQDGPTFVHGKGGGLGPVAVAVAYDYPVQHGYAGHGRNVGNVIGVDFQNSDLAAFFSEFGITPGGTITRVPLDGGPGSGTAGLLESTTDVEAILGLAPDANYYEYLIPVLDEFEIENAYAKALADNIVDVVNSSFGVCEAQDPSAEYDFDSLALQGSAKGITFVAATGDGGSMECPGPGGSNVQGIDVPSAGYYFTAVGATDLQVDPQTGSYVSESASPTSGGGYSQFLPLPKFQQATSGTNPAGRNVPDLALLGGSASGYDIVINGTDLPSSGTSVASALFTGYVSELDEIQKRRNGWLEPRLYRIFDVQGYKFAFRDITVGSNGLFNAGTGYDLVSGIGSLLGWELAGTF